MQTKELGRGCQHMSHFGRLRQLISHSGKNLYLIILLEDRIFQGGEK